MSTTPVHQARPQAPPAPPASSAEEKPRRRPTREQQVSARIRRSTVHRRLTQATDALAFVDLLLGMRSSVAEMGAEAEVEA